MTGIDRAHAGVRTLLGINLLWIGFSMLFDGMHTLLLPSRLQDAGASSGATSLGIISFVGIAVGMLVQPVAGRWSDEIRPRSTRMAQLGLAVAATVLSLAVFASAGSLVLVAAAYLLVQVVANAGQAAHQALLPDLVPERLRGRAAGAKGFMDLFGAVLGFVVLGAVLEGGGVWVGVAIVSGVLLAAYGLARALVREPRGRDPAPVVPWTGAFSIDLRRHGDFVRVVVARFLFLLATYGVGRFFLLFVADRLDIGVEQATAEAGALLGALALITAVSAVPSGWLADRLGRSRVMAAGSLLSAVGAALLVTAGSGPEILLFGSVMSVGSAAFSAANWALAADLAPRAEAARFLGLANVGTAGAAAAAGLLGPLIDLGNRSATGRGYTVLFVVAVAAFLASAFPVRRIADPLRRGPGAAPSDAAPAFSGRPVPTDHRGKE